MRTETTKRDLYLFHELSDEAKANAISNHHGLNVMDDYWCESILYDARAISIEIESFNGDRGEIQILLGATEESVAREILKNHGKDCATYKLANDYLNDTNETGWLTGAKGEGADREEEFTHALGEEYLSMLRKEYEYCTSDEAIREAIGVNEYEFTKDGESA